MAVWLSSQAMLTETGDEILDKVRVGIGHLDITRISGGEGLVPPESLKTLAAVQDPFVDAAVITKETSLGSSIVNLKISNGAMNAQRTGELTWTATLAAAAPASYAGMPVWVTVRYTKEV
jgi:hypothetical protein